MQVRINFFMGTHGFIMTDERYVIRLKVHTKIRLGVDVLLNEDWISQVQEVRMYMYT